MQSTLKDRIALSARAAFLVSREDIVISSLAEIRRHRESCGKASKRYGVKPDMW